MSDETEIAHIKSLIGKARQSAHATDALQWSQAASNAAHAIRILHDIQRETAEDAMEVERLEAAKAK